MGKYIHGLAKRGQESTTYSTWKHIRQRCNNPQDNNYHHYGGRGISVCSRWNSYSAFLEDMGICPKGLEIDRIDNNGNYEPSNCRWADKVTQANNRRNCRIFEYEDKKLTVKQWSKEKKISYGTLIDRLNNGWDFVSAIETVPPSRLTDEQKQTILLLRSQGFKKNEIRDKTGIEYDKIKYVLKVNA